MHTPRGLQSVISECSNPNNNTRGWSYDRQAHPSYHSRSPYSENTHWHTHTHTHTHITTYNPSTSDFSPPSGLSAPAIKKNSIDPPTQMHFPSPNSPHWVPAAPSAGRAGSCAPGWPGSAGVWSRCKGSSRQIDKRHPRGQSRRQKTWHSCAGGQGNGSSTRFWLEASACNSKTQSKEKLER